MQLETLYIFESYYKQIGFVKEKRDLLLLATKLIEK